MRELGTGSVFLYAVLLVQAVHQPDIDEDQDDENVDGSLVGKPEAEFGATNGKLVRPVDGENAQAVGNDKPNGQEDQHITDVLLPVSCSFFLIHDDGFDKRK